MDIEKLRNKFWDEFFAFKDEKRLSLFDELSKSRFIRKHSIQVYDKDNLRLMIGVNEKFARCSLHITWDDLEQVHSVLRNQEADLIQKFRHKRQPELTIKRNPASVVIFLKDYGYQFPPSSQNEKTAFMEWLYQNAIAMNEIARDLIKGDVHPTEKTKTPKQSTPKIQQKFGRPVSEKSHPMEYGKLVETIYGCTEVCKKPKDQMLLGRLMAGNSKKIDLMLVGIGPLESYAEKRKKRVVFGEYSPTGAKVRKLISIIERNHGPISCWGTNAIKCDHRKEDEKSTILRCRKHLLPELEIINPTVVVLFGAQLSKIYLNKSLAHGEIGALFDQYRCIQSIHPASRASGKRFDDQNIELLANKIIENL